MLNPNFLQEELPALLQIYERRGHFDEVLSLLEAGLVLERAHVGSSCYFSVANAHVSSDGCLYGTIDLIQQVQTNKAYVSVIFNISMFLTSSAVMEHLKLFVARINIPKV